MSITIRTIEPSTSVARRARLATAAAAVLVGAGVALAPAASAATGPSSAPFTPEQNSPDAWCADGWKVEMGGEQFTFQLTEPAAILVLKAATTNYWWTDAEPGTYTVPGKNAISHVIVCPAHEPTDEPSQPTDEPSQPTDEPSQPTDEPGQPTDEPTEPAEVPTPQATSPAPVTEVSSSSTPLPVVETELAHTGGSQGGETLLAGLGLALLAGGAVAMRLGRGGSRA